MDQVSLLKAVRYTFENDRREEMVTTIRWQLASVVDYLFSFSLTTSRKAVSQQGRFVFYSGPEMHRISGTLVLIKCVVFSILFFYTNWKKAALFTVAGLAAKWGIRRKANLFNCGARPQLDPQELADAKKYLNDRFPTCQTGPFANFKTHLIRLQNQCDFMLALFGKGFEELETMEKSLSTIGSGLKIGSNNNGSVEMLQVTIGNETKAYPVSFLNT
ncbi:MAG: hypothetical protein KDK71_05250 [Chlamydiia bacterium]|nr:hypothetical protein [Chlamydiia bacterium]